MNPYLWSLVGMWVLTLLFGAFGSSAHAVGALVPTVCVTVVWAWEQLHIIRGDR